MEKERRPARKSLSHNQVHALVRAVQRHGSKRDVAIVQLPPHTGVRVGELVGLRLADAAMTERKRKITVRWGKGGRYREIDLNLDARQALGEYLAVRPTVADGHLFIGQRGNELTTRAVQDLVSKHPRLAFETPHALRDTSAKNLLDAGENLVAAARLTGRWQLGPAVARNGAGIRARREALRAWLRPTHDQGSVALTRS